MRHGEDHHLLLQIVKLREELANVEIIARAAIVAIEAAQNPSNPKEAFPPGGDCPGLLVIYEQCVRKSWLSERNAKPVEKLNDANKKLQTLGTMRRPKTVDQEPKENDLPSRSSGTILSRGDNNNNTGRQALGPQAKRTKLNHSSKAPLAICKDTTSSDQAEMDKSKPEFGSWLMLGGRSERNKENNALPGKWVAFKLPLLPPLRFL
ncbi:LOW QUALITY PROTEIN: mitotic spindle checkpoint protein BUBR1 [Raphanus sativus]|uniref:LOW QUALITY PROTEIN: mitotic spindle checkpoint protein BUBR1 n=1 Tax=Raphanus sativus TaxID=3726 RepID=A0A9W3D8U0_RAPSA|nr:LOW QUALITY PROTEIN: mitotic spindle checkpoint protein BUBR1 [Raphanus sativus]